MGAMTAMMVGLGAVQAGTQIYGGFQQKKEAEANAKAIETQSAYNAGVYREQAGMIEQQKQLKAAQDDRAMRFAAGKHTAITSAKGLQFSGSALAVLNDTMTQMQMDKAITQYNYDMEKYGVLSQAEMTLRGGTIEANAYRRKGNTAMYSGIVGGLSTLYGTAAYLGARNYTPAGKKVIDTSGGAKTGGKP